MKDIEAGVNHNNHGSEKHRTLTPTNGGDASAASAAALEHSRRRSQVEDPHKKIHKDTTDPSLSCSLSASSNNGSIAVPNGASRQASVGQPRPALEKAPSSRNGSRLLPVISAMAAQQQQQQQTRTDPRLIHPILLQLPLQFRFGVTGLMSNILFMVVYNMALEEIPQVPPSYIYAVVYFFFIPASHLMVSLFVFGWPPRYFSSLMSNFPIGLTALALGGLLTAYLDQVGFNVYVASYIRDFFTFTYMPPLDARKAPHDEEGEFYSSLLVLMVTSLWTYILSVYVNSRSPAKSHKKEL